MTVTTTILIYTGTTLLWLWWGKWQNDTKNRLEKELRELRKKFLLYKSSQEAQVNEMQKELLKLKKEQGTFSERGASSPIPR